MEKAMEFEKLNDSNWPKWKTTTEDFFVGKELDQPLNGKEAQPEGMEDKVKDALDRKCFLAFLLQYDLMVANARPLLNYGKLCNNLMSNLPVLTKCML